MTENDKKFAFKKLTESDLDSLSKLFKEMSFILRLNKDMPLLNIEKIFFQ